MTEQEVIDLMETSQTREEWNKNCDEVKSRCNGYPEFWWPTMKLSGRMDRIVARWGSDSQIRVAYPLGKQPNGGKD